jgi:Type II secretion system (T2SS), protein G
MRLGTTTYLILGLLAVLVVVFVVLVDTVPARSMTHVNMHMMKRRILRYAAANGSLPPSSDQLPRVEGYANEVVDGWGRPILWQVESDEVTLTSYGRDGVPGGTGEHADMVGVFRTKTSEGRWANELCEWRHDPYAAVN